MGPSFTLSADELLELTLDARRHTLKLVADLSDAQLEVPVMAEVNPFRWELGHVAFFYDAFLLQILDARKELMEGSEDLFNSFDVAHDERWGLVLPSREETLAYMERVLEAVADRLRGRIPSAYETYLYLLGVLHESMHTEAFTYMRQTLGYSAPDVGQPTLVPGSGCGPWTGDASVPGGEFQLGADPDAPFVFDNEKWTHPVQVAPFRIARAPVTNGEFAAFVDDEGYSRRELWTRGGWIWREGVGASHPIDWSSSAKGWQRREFDCVVPIAEHAPVVHVCWHEAEAFCRWAGRRLPSEAEWELAASAEPGSRGWVIARIKRRYPWGDDPDTEGRANLDFRAPGCVDVAAHPDGDSAFGCRQMLGNVWEWTGSAFYPYPGYVVDLPYREYSAPWFGYRKVLKGGAWATRSRLVNNTYRNFFEPTRRDVFAGFRTCAV